MKAHKVGPAKDDNCSFCRGRSRMYELMVLLLFCPMMHVIVGDVVSSVPAPAISPPPQPDRRYVKQAAVISCQ